MLRLCRVPLHYNPDVCRHRGHYYLRRITMNTTAAVALSAETTTTGNLTKHEIGRLSPEARDVYKKRTKNEKRKAASRRLSPEERRQVLASRALKKKEQRLQKKTDGAKIKPRPPYETIHNKSPSAKEKQRDSWKKSKARQRKKLYAQQAGAHLDARRHVDLQVKLEDAKYNLNQASDGSVAALQCEWVSKASLATNAGNCTDSTITLADDGSDLFMDQQQRFAAIQFMFLSHSSFWECRGIGDMSSIGIEIARS